MSYKRLLEILQNAPASVLSQSVTIRHNTYGTAAFSEVSGVGITESGASIRDGILYLNTNLDTDENARELKLSSLSSNEARMIADNMIDGLERCDMEGSTTTDPAFAGKVFRRKDCVCCKMRCAVLQQLLDQEIYTGHAYRDLKKKWGLRDNSAEYQTWLAHSMEPIS